MAFWNYHLATGSKFLRVAGYSVEVNVTRMTWFAVVELPA